MFNKQRTTFLGRELLQEILLIRRGLAVYHVVSKYENLATLQRPPNARPPVIRTPQKKVQMMGRGRGVDDEAAIEFDSMVCSLCNATSSDHYYS